MTRSLKIKLRCVAGIVVLILLFLGIALLPGRIEGVYRAEALAGSSCMDCRSYFEIREGRGIHHVIEDRSIEVSSSFFMDYEIKPSGAIAIRLHPTKADEINPILTRAYPHFLLTKFVSEEDHKSTWIWKVPTCFGLQKKLAAVRIKEVLIEADAVRDVFYDSTFKVIETRVRPNKQNDPGNPK